MDFKKIFNKVYPIQEYKKLRKENPLGFCITILIPLLLLFTFLYLYFYPFGYNRVFLFNGEDIEKNIFGQTNFSNLEKENNGVTLLTFEPTLAVRNPNIRLSVKGDGVYVLPLKEEMGELKDIWEYESGKIKKEILDSNREYEENEFGEFTYGYIDEYIPKELGMYTVYMRYMPEIEEGDSEDEILYAKDQQLLFKYKNMRVIQNPFSLELRVDEVHDGNLYTYQTYNFLPEDFFNKEHELVAVYKESTKESNGYIELFLNGIRSERIVVSSPYNLFFDYDDLKQYEVKIESEVLNDLNQDIISLGQEIYRVNMDKKFTDEVRRVIDINLYYEELFKSNLPEKHIDDMFIPLSVYYDKPFYNYFEGSIYELRIGYDYPFEQVKELSELYSITPFTLPIVGNREDIEEVKLEVYRDSVWKKLRGL